MILLIILYQLMNKFFVAFQTIEKLLGYNAQL